ncbi:MAG: hypothetical protein ACXV95_10745 [Acidimicrobiales bacterium]
MRRMSSAEKVATGVLALLVMASVAGCSSSSKDETSGTSAEKSAVAPETTASTAAPTTTLGPPPPAGTIPFVDLGADAATDGVSPIGSGCTPQTTGLPDGRWFGGLRSIDTAAGTLGLDLECLFTGDAANAAAAADGASEVPVPNDVYVRNENQTVRTLHAVSDVAVGVLTYQLVGGVQFEPTKTGLATAGTLVDKSIWVEVLDGWVVAIQEQYFP